MHLEKAHFYLLGIKGAAMSNIAALLKSLGKDVSGADVDEVFPTDTVLLQNSIKWDSISSATLPQETEVVVYAAAHGGKNNPIVIEAQKRGLIVIHQAELLGQILKEFSSTLAVAGCHGKTTTSSLLAYALLKLGKDPSYMVGTPSFNEYQGNHLGDYEYFVIEADEYAMHPPENKTPKFHHLKPTNAIITNIDFDHPDVYDNLEDTKQAFITFMEQVSSNNDALSLIVCADDENTLSAIKNIKGKSIAKYGISEDADYRAKNIYYDADKTRFQIYFQDEKIGDFTIKIPGEKNVVNATGVITLLFQLGFAPQDIRTAIADFTGAKRRFEHIATLKNVSVYDDYAHHPTELKAIIEASRSKFPKQNLRIVFQPHTYSRTKSMGQEFIDALKLADTALILPVFASAREKQTESSFSNSTLVEMAQKQGVKTLFAPQTNEEAIALLKEHVIGRDIVITAGAGDIYKLQPAILSMLETL